MWTSKRGRESEETGTDSEMTDETEETFTDPDEAPTKRTRRGVPEKPRIPRKKPPSSIHSVESGSAIRAEQVEACSCKRTVSIRGIMGKSLKSS